jgi:hypothetical protein
MRNILDYAEHYNEPHVVNAAAYSNPMLPARVVFSCENVSILYSVRGYSVTVNGVYAIENVTPEAARAFVQEYFKVQE